ncbi:hypothetical protein GIS00_01375 [Nakamurella sp. YIM 132087]|uniref:DUF11 domain-containing protein n=1 Tax=Nakamurella alba TaxID=2665158 RepID=A0A7K1FI81_9ACTN|nr:hypothetical protein [Nakamurella alba]MTD12594.1 hypothetical protein [Nakamurella alba]
MPAQGTPRRPRIRRIATLLTAILLPVLTASVLGAGPAAAAAGADFRLSITASDSLEAGRTDIYEFTVVNRGDSIASPVLLVLLPESLQFAGLSGGQNCAAAGQRLSCQIFAVLPGDEAVLELRLTAAPDSADAQVRVLGAVQNSDGSSPFVDPGTCTGTDQPAVGCAVSASRTVGSGIALELGVVGPTFLEVGVPTDYQLLIANRGTAPAAGATVLNALPSGVRLLDVSTGGTCTSGPEMRCSVTGPIGPDTVAVLGLWVVATGPATGTSVRDVASLDVTGGDTPQPLASCVGDPLPAGCAESDDAEVLPGVDLTLDIDTPATSAVGRTNPFAVTVSNTGSLDLLGPATVGLAIPAGLEVQAVQGAECSVATATLLCRVPGPFPAGGAPTVVTLDMLSTNASSGTSVSLRAAVDNRDGGVADPTACAGGPEPLGCAVGDPLFVAPGPVLGLGMKSPSAVVVSSKAVYSVEVHNSGTAPFTAPVAVSWPSTAGPAPDGATCTAAATGEGSQELSCALQRPVAPGATATFTLHLEPAAAQVGSTVVVRASVDPFGGTPASPLACEPGDTCAVSTALVVTAATPTSGSSTSAGPTSGSPTSTGPTSTTAPMATSAPATSTDLAATGLPVDSWWPVVVLLLGAGAVLVRIGRRRAGGHD